MIEHRDELGVGFVGLLELNQDGRLFIQRNAKALVELARAEKDPDLKRELVSKLSVMKTPEATDYMLELLK